VSWLNKYQGKDFNKKKTKINIDATHVFTVCFLLIGLFAFISAHAVEVKTNSKPLFVYSLNSCITDLNKTIPTEKQDTFRVDCCTGSNRNCLGYK